jgi:Flp pilus assembly pilin Flp
MHDEELPVITRRFNSCVVAGCCEEREIYWRQKTMKEQMTRLYVKVRESAKRLGKGQTMTEYALILAAVAIVVFITYEVMGQDISKLVNNIDSALTTT